MENEKKSSKGSNIVIIILAVLVIGLGGYIGYDKFLNDNNTDAKENSKVECDNKDATENTEEDKNVENTKGDNNNEEVNANNNDYTKKRICTGVYSGKAVLSGDVSTGQYSTGTLTIELKEDGTYALMKEKVYETPETGEYIIFDNALLLRTTRHTCGPDDKCSNYTEFLDISEDCSEISGRYGEVFLDSNFTLTKQK